MKISTALAAMFIAATGSAQERQRIDGALSIEEAVALARKLSPALVAARSEVRAMASEVGVAASALAPQISANGFASSGSYGSILSSSPGVMPPYWLLAPKGGLADQNIMAMAPLFTGGRLSSAVSAATWRRRAAEADLDEMDADITLKVRDAYYRTLVAKQAEAHQGLKLLAVQELLRITKAQFEAGKTIEASVLRVEAEQARAQRSLTSARNDAGKALLELEAAMGVDLRSNPLLTDTLVTTAQSEVLSDFLERSKTQRPRLIAARARVQAAAAEVRSAGAQRSPHLYAQAMADAASRDMMSGAAIGLTLSIPIFDGGRISHEIGAARAREAKAQADLSDAEIAVESEIRQAWLDLETAQANTASAEGSVKAAQSAYDVVALRVSAGKAILVEQMDALQALTEARADLAQATYELNIAIAKLRRASGGSK